MDPMSVAVQTPLFRFADLLLGNTLVKRLQDWRDEGMSHEHIAQELYVLTERKVRVTGPTIASWLKSLEIS